MAAAQRKTYVTPVKQCRLCGGSLANERLIDATMIDMDGNHSVKQQSMRCTSRDCKAIHHYNFVWSHKRKLNTVRLSQVEALFVNPKLGFSKTFLLYHDALQFRGFLSTNAVVRAGESVLFQDWISTRLHKDYNVARRLMLVLQEFQDMWAAQDENDTDLFSIDLHEPIADATLQEYDAWLHTTWFPPAMPRAVAELVADGHHKVMVRLCAEDATPRRAGRPRTGGKRNRKHGNGWFMVADPTSGRILSVVEMTKPEGNHVVLQAVQKVIPLYPNVDLLVYDRVCKVKAMLGKSPALKQIKHLAVDKFHAHRHSASCTCNPHKNPVLRKRLKAVNTCIAEQVFSWFRGYAKMFNNMQALHHRFMVLQHVRRHNTMVDVGDRRHLNKFSYMKHARKPYACPTPKQRGQKRTRVGSVPQSSSQNARSAARPPPSRRRARLVFTLPTHSSDTR